VTKTTQFDSPTYAGIDFRAEPERYHIGRGEQGVLTAEPYKSEILPHWRFRTPEMARDSSHAIFALFEQFRDAGDFVGMDMARKFLQMGWTRARRYANHASGRKYDRATGALLTGDPDPVKAESAAIFRAAYDRARADPIYVRAKAAWRAGES
jgi:hypothetical protein